MQPAKVGAKLSSSKSPLGEIIDVQDTHKLSKPNDIGLHIEDQVDRKGINILYSKTSLVCHISNKPGL